MGIERMALQARGARARRVNPRTALPARAIDFIDQESLKWERYAPALRPAPCCSSNEQAVLVPAKPL
jgi:hypothetical protein